MLPATIKFKTATLKGHFIDSGVICKSFINGVCIL